MRALTEIEPAEAWITAVASSETAPLQHRQNLWRQ